MSGGDYYPMNGCDDYLVLVTITQYVVGASYLVVVDINQ